jgi:toxin ParE1/3/4
MVLEFRREATEEMIEATSYYEDCEPGLGVRFRLEVESMCAGILRHALLWSERRGGYRRVNLAGFPYYIAYCIRGERLFVIAVAHASRHPDYWKTRSRKRALRS